MIRPAVLALAAAVVTMTLVAGRASPLEDETRDRVLLTHQSRGTLAPGTRPKCFPSGVDDTVAASQYRCPWERASRLPRYPTIRSGWGLFGSD